MCILSGLCSYCRGLIIWNIDRILSLSRMVGRIRMSSSMQFFGRQIRMAMTRRCISMVSSEPKVTDSTYRQIRSADPTKRCWSLVSSRMIVTAWKYVEESVDLDV